MSETYRVYLPNGRMLRVDEETNEIIFSQPPKPTGKYTQRYSEAVFEADAILRNSPYKDYKEIPLDPELKTGQSSTLLEFKQWQDLYLKDPVKGAIAPWTKAEKAYYESLKTKRERYKYLTIRSGLRSTVINIPYEAYACAEDEEKFKKYKELFEIVEMNRGGLGYTYLMEGEWALAAGILGDIRGFGGAITLLDTGFKARGMQILRLYCQLGGGAQKGGFKILEDSYNHGILALTYGNHANYTKVQMVRDLAQNLPFDEFGMLPYLDELISADWILDLNKYQFAYDEKATALIALCDRIQEGKLKDPRDVDSTPESRRAFDDKMDGYKTGMRTYFDADIPNDWTEQQAQLYIDTLILSAKLAALTPPQGYPNAPFYYSPERLEWIYQKGDLDKRLNPTIPAMYRYNFPEDLRKKIESYAKEHNIKE